MIWLTLSLAAAAPDIDTPLRTGARQPADAAVVIGIEDYAFLPDVPYADRDAQAMEDLFIYTMGIPYDRVHRLGGEASKEQILAAVDDAAALVGPEGTLWLYYAGHGAASPSTGERMLLGVDTMANATSFEARAVSIERLKDSAADVHRTVLLVDACYAGASRGGQELLAGKRFAVPAYVKPETGGWVEWNAAQPNELSGPLEPMRHGAFTFAVAGAFRGWADGQLSGVPDGVITLEEAQLFVGQTLRTVDVRDQRPDLSAADLQGAFATLPLDRAEEAPSPESLRAMATGAPPPSPAPAAPVTQASPAPSPPVAPPKRATQRSAPPAAPAAPEAAPVRAMMGLSDAAVAPAEEAFAVDAAARMKLDKRRAMEEQMARRAVADDAPGAAAAAPTTVGETDVCFKRVAAPTGAWVRMIVEVSGRPMVELKNKETKCLSVGAGRVEVVTYFKSSPIKTRGTRTVDLVPGGEAWMLIGQPKFPTVVAVPVSESDYGLTGAALGNALRGGGSSAELF